MATAYLGLGKTDTALEYSTQATAVLRSLRSMVLIEHLTDRTMIFTALRRFDEARECSREVLELMRKHRTDSPALSAHIVQRIAAVGALRPCGHAIAADNDHRCAARLLGHAAAVIEAQGIAGWPLERNEVDRVLEALRNSLGAAALADLMREGADMSHDQAMKLALSI